MTTLRRWVPVLAAMTVATSLSSTLAIWLYGIAPAAMHALGLIFAVAVWLALLTTKHWHAVRVETEMMLPAIVVVGLAFPALLWGGALSTVATASVLRGFRIDPWGGAWLVTATMTVMSAIGARVVAAGMRWVTARHDRSLRRLMVAWGASWTVLHAVVPPRMRPLELESLLAWHLPIGLACAAWVLRSPPARERSAT